MKTISRYIMTLALLITAVTGAWADSFSTEAYTADATLSAVSVTGNTTLTINEGVTVTVNNGLTINDGVTLTVTGGGSLAVNGATGANTDHNSVGGTGSTAIGGSGQLAIANATITATGGTGGNGGSAQYECSNGGDGAPAVSGVSISIQKGSFTAIGGGGGTGGTAWGYDEHGLYGAAANAFSSFPNISDATLSYSTDNVTYTKYESGNTTLYRYMKIEPLDGPAVTIGDGNGEASFEMPQNDVTVTYTLKRDMTVDMAVTVQDAQQNSRFRVQKQGNVFEPVGLTNAQVMALFTVHDDIESKDLTATTDYTVQIFAADDNGDPTGTAMTFQTFTYAPGNYIVKAVAAEGSNYVGTTEQSNVFTLYQGYPVDVAAQSFATYYSEDEALTLEESFAETAGLYTVASVTAAEAVLSEKIDVMPKRTPMLIYNESETAQQILLIPTADVPPLTDVADEFKGTAVEKEVTAEEVAATNFYVLTDQNQFVWVKDAGTIAAHRCWLEIAPSEAAGARRIVFSGSGTTGISTTDYTDYTDGTFYDLNGRKINMPTKKGVYIFNGKKVVIK